MSKYSKSKPKTSSGSYIRLTGEKDLSNVFTKVQSTVISNGTELEKRIVAKSKTIENLDDFISKVNNNIIKTGIFLCPKKVIKNSSEFALEGQEPDFLIFNLSQTTKECTVLELKDGDALDTKKSQIEHDMLIKYSNFIARKIPFIVDFKICCFNQSDKKQIRDGLRKKFELSEIYTGKELCEKLKISYNSILKERKREQTENLNAIKKDIYSAKTVKNDIVITLKKCGADEKLIRNFLRNIKTQCNEY